MLSSAMLESPDSMYQTSSPVGPGHTLSVWPGSLDFKLGLSFVDNFRKEVDEGKNTPTQPINTATRRGLQGITAYGKRMVKSACAILQKRHGHKNLTFGTLTLPELTPGQRLMVSENWGHLKGRFSEELSRLLKRRGLDPDWVDVTEVQAKRWRRRKQVALHLHYLHQGRVPGTTYSHPGVAANDLSTKWAIHPREIRAIWQRLLENLLGVEVDCSSATRIEQVKLNAAHYLAKYMSKGGSLTRQIIDAGRGHFLPSAWYGVSAALRKEIKSAIVHLTPKQACRFLEDFEYYCGLGAVEWYYPIYQDMWLPGSLAPGDHLVGIVGTFRDERVLKLLRGELDDYGYRNWYLSDEYWATQDVA